MIDRLLLRKIYSSLFLFLFLGKRRGGGKGRERIPKERPKNMYGCNEAKSYRKKRSPVLWQTRPGPSQKNLLALRIGIRLTETVTVAVTVTMQLVGQSEGKLRVPVVFGREVPTMEIMVEVPVVVVRVGDGEAIVLGTEAVPEVPMKPGDVPGLEPVPVPAGNVPVSDSVPVRG